MSIIRIAFWGPGRHILLFFKEKRSIDGCFRGLYSPFWGWNVRYRPASVPKARSLQAFSEFVFLELSNREPLLFFVETAHYPQLYFESTFRRKCRCRSPVLHPPSLYGFAGTSRNHHNRTTWPIFRKK